MAREFTKNMLIMLVAIMIGIAIITFFIADVMRQSQIETLSVEHKTEIQDITYKSENFTDHFLQGIVKMDAAREIREVGNYHFDFALFWYSNARANTTIAFVDQCIENCTDAMTSYLSSYDNFHLSQPYFEQAKNFTERAKYIEVLGYYVAFSQAGQNITLLRYDASQYLKYAVENLSLGNMENVSILMNLFNETVELYAGQVEQYNDYGDQIDEYLFFDEIREEH
ncbi:MAG: hypothetical protein NT038_09475 [Euryarchaeota archaeon]|nr:hypothetical protein [Euryarchaeota archaeon]